MQKTSFKISTTEFQRCTLCGLKNSSYQLHEHVFIFQKYCENNWIWAWWSHTDLCNQSWQCFATKLIFVNFQQFWADFCWFSSILVNFWQFLSILINFCRFLTIFKISKTKGKWLKTSKITVQNWLKLLKINFCQFRLIKNQSKSIFVDFELIFDDFCQFWSIFIDFRQFFYCQDWLQTPVGEVQQGVTWRKMEGKRSF